MENLNSTNTTVISVNIGGIPYILDYLAIYLPYSILSFIGVIIGLIGNILIITAVMIHHDLRKNSTCLMILNLAFSDLLISLFVNTSTVAGVYAGKKFFDQNMALCVFLGAACLISCGTSLVTMGLLAVNRYICIFHHHLYTRIFSVRNTIICCVIAWAAGIAVDLPNFFGIGAHVYDTKAMSCLFDRLKVGYTIAFSVGCIIIPCLLIGFVYMLIFWHAFNIRTKVVEVDVKNKNATSYRSTVEAVRIAKSLFASFFIFSACWIPVSIIFIIGKDDQLPIPAHTFTNLPAHLNSAINPIFYGVFNPKIREGYRNLFRIITCNKYFNRRVSDFTFTKNSKRSTKIATMSIHSLSKIKV